MNIVSAFGEQDGPYEEGRSGFYTKDSQITATSALEPSLKCQSDWRTLHFKLQITSVEENEAELMGNLTDAPL